MMHHMHTKRVKQKTIRGKVGSQLFPIENKQSLSGVYQKRLFIIQKGEKLRRKLIFGKIQG